MNDNKFFLVELIIVILNIIWIYIGVDLVIHNGLSLIVFLLCVGILLSQTFKLIFTENRTEQRKTINTNKTISK